MSVRWFFVAALSLGLTAQAAPVLQGAPQLHTAQPGGGFSGFRSRYAVQALSTGDRLDEAGALGLCDTRTGARALGPLGELGLRFTDASGARLGGARTVVFEPVGWTETRTDGELTLQLSVFTLAHDVFAVVAKVDGVASALTVEGRLDAGAAGTATVTGTDVLTATLDTGEGRPFGVALRVSGTPLAPSSAGGTGWFASVSSELTSSGTVAFVLAFHDTPAQAEALATSVSTGAGDPANWLALTRAAWGTHYAAHTKPHTTDAALVKADEVAAAVLWHNELGTSADQVLGAVPSKTRDNLFEARDSAFHALGALEQSPARAFAHLEAAYRGQLATGENAGLIPGWQKEDGTRVGTGSAAAIDTFSETPAFGWALRAIQDQGGAGETEKLTRALNAGLASTAWWRARRDKDTDYVLELNGAIEAGQPTSPRFSKLWQTDPQLPVPDANPRPRFDAVDLSAELHHDYVEYARIASALGRTEDARQLRARSALLAAQLDEGDYGGWDEANGRYADYYLVGTDRARVLLDTFSAATLAPLAGAAARDPSRVRRVAAHLLSTDELWVSAGGVTSLAKFDLAYDPGLPWAGALAVEQQYQAAAALYRYGYEAEARQLADALVHRLANLDPAFHAHHHAATGAGAGTAGSGTAAALYLAALRNRWQAEAFVLERGDRATKREGALRRLFGLDGQLVMEVAVDGTHELPVMRITAPTQLFTDPELTLELSDPHGLVVDRTISISLPLVTRAKVRRINASGTTDTVAEGAGLVLEAKAGDRLELTEVRLVGEGCGCTSGGGSLALVGVLLAGRLLGRRRAARRK